MEAEKGPFEKERHLQTTIFFSSMFQFWGCIFQMRETRLPGHWVSFHFELQLFVSCDMVNLSCVNDFSFCIFCLLANFTGNWSDATTTSNHQHSQQPSTW